METITRKTMLYRTGVEYGDLDCSHGCKYPCYAFMLKKRFGKVRSYDEWIQPKLFQVHWNYWIVKFHV